MADNKQPTGPQGGDYYPPPPPGPPPGHNGLQMHPNETPIQDAPSDIYSSSPPTASGAQQTAHQPPPADTDDAPKKTNWTQRLSVFGSKAAAPFNMLANKLGSEAFLPSTMDKECEKAARILRNFCSTFRLHNSSQQLSLIVHKLTITLSQRTASTQTPKPPKPSRPRQSTPMASPPPPPPSPGKIAPS